MSEYFDGRLAIQQRVVPRYRAVFFESLAGRCRAGLTVYAGQPLAMEAIHTVRSIDGVGFHSAATFHLFFPGHPLFLCWQPGLISWLEKMDPDLLIVEANPRYRSIARAVDWMHHRQRPVLGWGLGSPPQDRSWRFQSRSRWLSRLDGILSYSRQGASEYQRLGLWDPACVFYAPNAVAISGTLNRRRPPALKDGARLRLLFVGRLQDRKRLDLLIKACAVLPRDRRPQLVIVGDGPAGTALRQMAADLHPDTRFTGALEGVDLEREFLSADLFVLPGTGGLAVQEAMSYGLPAIVAEGDGTQADLIRPGNGWLVPPGDLFELVKAVNNAISDPVKLARMGEESRRIVTEEINLDVMVAAFIQAARLVRIRR